MRVLLSGGGTAGHVYPALAVAAELLEGAHDEVVFVGTPDGTEARLVPDADIPFRPLRARGFDRSRPLTLATSTLAVTWSAVRAAALLRRWRPDVVVGFGGYVSIPVGLAASFLQVPLVLHEQNSVPGLANRFLSRFARAVAVTYAGSEAALRYPERARLTGNPIRRSVTRASRSAGRALMGLPPEALVLLVFGGSRGARHVNEATVSLFPRLRTVTPLRVVHVAGSIEAASVRERLARVADANDRWYHVEDYIEDMGSAIAAADLVIARAGATSVAEITALGKASVLVPYPFATDDHQTHNARALEAAGGAVVVPDHELDRSLFGDSVLRLLMDGDTRERMAEQARMLGRPDAAQAVAALVREVGARHLRGDTSFVATASSEDW